MDNDDELLMQDEPKAVTGQEQQMLVLALLLHYQKQLNIVPRHGGLRVGKVKNKDQHWLGGALLPDSDYFVDNATNIPKEFRRYFRMK
jgi:hypothetical protein